MPTPALGRADFLRAIDDAAAAYAAGRADPGEDLAGRRFLLRQAFGCKGTTGPDGGQVSGVARWSWGPLQRTIALSLTPSDWARLPILKTAESPWEAVEGYWLTRPWLRAEGCPVVHPSATPQLPAPATIPAPTSRQTAGLAAVFAHGGSRVGRRDGKPFSFTLRNEEGPPPAPVAGYRLVLEGRFIAPPDGRAIRCQADTPDQRPVCIATAELDRVAFEDADGKLLREWRPG
ncbi:MAG: hypothetical protein ABI655_09100 [Phenylobacterium sp.]